MNTQQTLAKNESWKYIDLAAFFETQFDTVSASKGDDVASRFPDEEAVLIHCLDGVPVERRALDLPDSVTVDWLSNCSQDFTEQVTQYNTRESAAYNPFTAINQTQHNDVIMIHVPEAVRLARPIRLIFNSAYSAPVESHPKIRIVLEKQAEATILITMEDHSEQNFWQNLDVQLTISESANCQLGLVNVDREMGYRFNRVYANLAEKANFKMTAFSRGGNITRHDIELDFTGEEANADLAGIAVASGKSQVFTHTRMNHIVPNCTSTQLFKNLLKDQAKTDYDGLVYVAKEAQLTDATQNNQNLLLSDDARAFARPQLEIDADDVKCAHGATIGQLNETELFYLQSRGLSRDEARSILMYGFVEEVVETLPDSPFKNAFEHWIKDDLLPSLKERSDA